MKLHREVRSLLKEITLYRQMHDLPETTFGVKATNNGHLIERMKAGRTPSLATIKRVRAFMKNGKAK